MNAAMESPRGENRYCEKDHETWARVLDMYMSRLDAIACPAVVDGFDRLELTRRICDLAELSDRVERICGWRLQPVAGLVSGADFVAMLRRRKYPVTRVMRRADAAEFSPLPDLFHDVVGHLPLLVHAPYAAFLEYFAEVLAAYSPSPTVASALGRFYWYTTEIGLAGDVDRPKIFGAAILTSSAECSRALAAATPRVPLDLDVAARTSYDIYGIQQRYFVSESLDQLCEFGPQLAAWAKRAAAAQ